jgi:hypothetical protein
VVRHGGIGRALRSPFFRFILPGCFLVAAVAASGATYYVSPKGNDSNPGTQNAPLRHISKAAGEARRPGDTVIVMDGTYDNEGVTAPRYVVTLRHSGASGNPITIRAQNRGKAILDSGNTSTGASCNGASAYFDLAGASFIVIQGFVIQHACDSGIQSNGTAHDITIRWNEFRSIANRTVTDLYGRDGIFLNENEYNFVFDGNIFHDIGRTGGVLLQQLDHGIYARAIGLTIVNNLFYNMTKGWHIQLAKGATDWLIANNTFVGPSAGEGQIQFWQQNNNITIRNNLFYNPRGFAVRQYDADVRMCAIDHNLVYGVSEVMKNTKGCVIEENRMGADPKFADAAGFDFHLLPGSPAIRAGAPVPAVHSDLDGIERPRGAPPDAGAFQFHEGPRRSEPAGPRD